MGDCSFNGIVRRMVCLPRSIMGGFSRVMGRRNHFQPPSFHLQNPQPLQPTLVPEEWAFLSSFEQQYGTNHPFFYACTFMEALRMAQDEHKFLFLYLNSPQHPFTPSFCTGTLCSELVTQFLDANFVCWGALADRGEGLQMAATLRPTTFPFSAVIAPAAGDSIAVLQQMEGPIGPGELVEILQRTMEEQGLAFAGPKAMEERGRQAMERVRNEERTRTIAQKDEKLRADRRVREDQDAAFFAALQRDKEKERLRNARAQTPVEAYNKANDEKLKHNHTQKQVGRPKQASVSQEQEHQTTQILIRFPNGERREQRFSSAGKILSIYWFIDSLGMPGIGNYRLISSFPRRIFGADQMGMTLKEAGLYPRASLFLELL